ncbi:hypothetical protein ACQY0O_001377 [Thecaphora frezii]
MVFQSYAPFDFHAGRGGSPSSALPLSMDATSHKRKACPNDGSDGLAASDFDPSSLHRSSNRLCLGRSSGLDSDRFAEFHPLPLDVSNAILASLSHDPLAASSTMQSSPTSSHFPATPASSYALLGGHAHKGSDGFDYFGGPNAHYPDLEIYPSQAGLYGLLGPQPGAPSAGMEVDGDQQQQQGHGPQCKSIARLSVRHNGGTTSELWASCPGKPRHWPCLPPRPPLFPHVPLPLTFWSTLPALANHQQTAEPAPRCNTTSPRSSATPHDPRLRRLFAMR